ncbi:MAG: hypothetical protein ACM3SS_18360 [Rhodospirillaceae bacterium]
MSRRLDELAQRRAQLIARAAEQRAAIAASGTALLPSGGLPGRAFLWKRIVRAHPLWIAAAVAATTAFLVRPRSATLWLGRALMTWRTWQALKAWLARPARS